GPRGASRGTCGAAQCRPPRPVLHILPVLRVLSVSLVPRVPSVPLVPRVPSVPLVPRVPSVPLVPRVPSVPLVPVYHPCCAHYESHDYIAHERESGYHDGFDRGKDDAEDCRALDPYHSHHYTHSHSIAYRDGFAHGYEAGYHDYTH